MLVAPDIDPVALRLGALEIRWYSLAYMAGFLFLRGRLRRGLGRPVDLFLLGAVLAMYLWGRVFYELVYDAAYAFAHPLEVLTPKGGGLSFHGALIGGGLATGFALYFLSDVVFALGASASVPMMLAAWSPAGASLLVGTSMLLYSEEG